MDGVFNGNYTYEYDDDYRYTDDEVKVKGPLWIPLLYSVVVIVGLLGNSLLLWVLAQKRRSWSISDTFILQLGIVDVLLLVTLPFWSAQADQRCGWCPEILFKIFGAIFNMNFYIGMFLLVFICLYNSMTSTHALCFSRFQATFTFIICMLVWFVSLFLTGFDWHFLQPNKDALQGKSICSHKYPESGIDSLMVLRLAHLIIGFLIPLALIIIICSQNFLQLKCICKGSQRKRPFLFIVTLTGVFLLCWIPYNLTLILDLLCYRSKNILSSVFIQPENSLRTAFMVTSAVACINACLRPLLYFLLCGNFRNKIMSLYKCATVEYNSSLWELGVNEEAQQNQNQQMEELKPMTCPKEQDLLV